MIAACMWLNAGILVGQELEGQIVIGYVADGITNQPVADARVDLIRDGTAIATVYTDTTGQFRSSLLRPGKLALRISHISYDTVRLTGKQLTSGKALKVTVILTSRSARLQEVEVRGGAFQSKLRTQMMILRTEDAEKIAGNFYDPARLAQSQSGAAIVNDQANQISVYGMAPHFVKWHVNGHEILNPNHLSNAGTFSDKPSRTGGGINVLSHQMLDYSILRLPPFQGEYNNALAGIMDMKLRSGNPVDYEWRAKASLIGLEFAGEGPVELSNNGSFLFNARYSTVGLLGKLGVDFGGESINFGDGAFHVYLPGKSRKSTLSIFGMGGFSFNRFVSPDDPAEYEEEKDLSDISFDEDIGILGANFDQLIGSKSLLKTGLGYSRIHHFREETQLNASNEEFLFQSDQSVERKLSAFLTMQSQVGAHFVLRGGVRLIVQTLNAESRFPPGLFEETYFVDNERNYIHPWVSGTFGIGKKIRLETGVSTYIDGSQSPFFLNANILFDWQLSDTYNFSFRASRTKQYPDLSLSTFTINDLNSQGYNQRMCGDNTAISFGANKGMVKSLSSMFYGHYDGMPSIATIYHDGVNSFNSYERPTVIIINPFSEARNYGISQLLNMQFRKNWQSIISISAFKSEYRESGGDGWSPAQYDNNFTLHFSIGKESNLNTKHLQSIIGWNVTTHLQGGLRELPVDEDASAQSPVTMYISENGFTERLDPYFRIDAQIYLEKDYEHSSTRLALDIQNVANIRNDAFSYYDHYLEHVIVNKQLGIVPVLSYQIDF